MKYNSLGNTGLFVSEICLGTMTFGGRGMWTAIGTLDQSAADGLFACAFDAGVNFVDTADVYSEGLSEEITGRALANSTARREDIVLATKCFSPTGNRGVNERGGSRAYIANAVKASLKRLGTDYIDLYQLHGCDPYTPVEETMRALEDMTRQGHIRYAGVSNWSAWKTMKALGIADRQGWARLASIQAYYSLAGRDIEREIAPLLAEENMGLLVWSPLAGGLLSGKYGRGSGGPNDARRASFDFPPVDRDRAFDCVDVLRRIAEVHDVSVARIALAWLLAQPVVTSVIVGAKTTDQLQDNLAAREIVLTDDELESLREVSELPSEYPGWMIAQQDNTQRTAVRPNG